MVAEALLPGPGQDLDTILYLEGNLCDERLPPPSPLPPALCWPFPRADRNFLLRPAEELGLLLQGQPQYEKEQKAKRQALLLSEPRGLGVLVLLHGELGWVSSGSLLAAPGLPPALSTDLSGDLHSRDQWGWKRLGWVCSGAQRQPGNPALVPGTMLLLVPLFKSHD